MFLVQGRLDLRRDVERDALLRAGAPARRGRDVEVRLRGRRRRARDADARPPRAGGAALPRRRSRASGLRGHSRLLAPVQHSRRARRGLRDRPRRDHPADSRPRLRVRAGLRFGEGRTAAAGSRSRSQRRSERTVAAAAGACAGAIRLQSETPRLPVRDPDGGDPGAGAAAGAPGACPRVWARRSPRRASRRRRSSRTRRRGASAVVLRGLPERQEDRFAEVLGPARGERVRRRTASPPARPRASRRRRRSTSPTSSSSTPRGAAPWPPARRCQAATRRRSSPRSCRGSSAALTFPKTMRWGSGDALVRAAGARRRRAPGRPGRARWSSSACAAGDRTAGHRVLSDGELARDGPRRLPRRSCARRFVEPDPEVRRDRDPREGRARSPPRSAARSRRTPTWPTRWRTSSSGRGSCAAPSRRSSSSCPRRSPSPRCARTRSSCRCAAPPGSCRTSSP